MKYICVICGYVHEGEQPPDRCPVCQVPAQNFVALPEEEQ